MHDFHHTYWIVHIAFGLYTTYSETSILHGIYETMYKRTVAIELNLVEYCPETSLSVKVLALIVLIFIAAGILHSSYPDNTGNSRNRTTFTTGKYTCIITF